MRSAWRSRVELPREESRGRLQDLVGASQLLDLTLEICQPLALVGGEARTTTGIALPVADPLTKGLALRERCSPPASPCDG
jgi:hypothetical protein